MAGLESESNGCLYDSSNRFSSIFTISTASFCAAWRLVQIGILLSNKSRKSPTKVGAASNSLSALLAVAIGINFLSATWPQPIMGAGFLTLVLAQSSVLGWYKYVENHSGSDTQSGHESEGIAKLLVDALLEKIPDVSAVGGTVFALHFTQTLYEQSTGNGWKPSRSPDTQGWTAVAITGVGLVLGTLSLVAKTYRTWLLGALAAILGTLSLVFTIIDILLSKTMCGYYEVAGYLVAMDLLLGAVIAFIHLYQLSFVTTL